MCARQRESCVVVVEGSARPVRSAVAGVASGWKAGGRVGGIVGTVIVGLVAVDASSAGQVVIAVYMACGALQAGVCSG